MKFMTIFIALAGLCFFACHSNENKNSKTKIRQVSQTIVKTYKVSEQRENNQISVLGIIKSETEARPSFKTGGVIRKTFVKEGDMIKKGQLLALLAMDEIDAQVKQAEEGFKKAERDMSRVRNLYADSVATLEQFQNVTTALELSKRNIEIAKFNRNYSEIRSPINGKVIKQMMFEGEITGPGNPIFYLLGVGSQDWVIQAGLTDRDWARVNLKDKVLISMDAYPGKSFTGYVKNKSSVGGNASGTFDVDIIFKDQPVNLAAGLITNIFISPAKNENYTVIPIEALVKTDGNTAFAFTVQNGMAKIIKLTIAKLLGDRVAISSGLNGVDVVVTTGAMYLEDGEMVTY